LIMQINLSFFKNIDFSAPDNLLFLSVVFVLALIIFVVVIIIILKIIKIIRHFFIKFFHLEAQKIKLDQKKTDWLSEKEFAERKEPAPRAKKPVVDFAVSVGSFEKNKEEVKDSIQVRKEKDTKDIVQELNQLKSKDSHGQETLDSKMSSRNENEPEDSSREKIEIPRPKRLSNRADSSGNRIQLYKDIVKSEQEKNTGDVAQGLAKLKSENNVILGKESVPAGATNSKPVYKQDENKIMPAGDVRPPENIYNGTKNIKQVSIDNSIFGGKSEVPKIKLEYEMRTNPKIWEVARQTGLNLSPVERSKLVEEIFSSALGRNISKSDLKLSVRKLNQKMLAAKDQKTHEKIRKEIKFFKKIGGIK